MNAVTCWERAKGERVVAAGAPLGDRARRGTALHCMLCALLKM